VKSQNYRWWYLKNRSIGEEILGIDIDSHLPADTDSRFFEIEEDPLIFSFPRNTSEDTIL
jgi:hypothetical protein